MSDEQSACALHGGRLLPRCPAMAVPDATACQASPWIRRLRNGYWAATIRLPWPDGGPDYVQSRDSFHDEEEARDWAEFQISFLTCTEDCCS